VAARLPDAYEGLGGPGAAGCAYRPAFGADPEADPGALQEQILIITEEGSSRPAATAFHEREIGAEESTGSIELLGVLRVRSSGRLALLVRREREAGFVLEWIERSRDGTWVVRWRSATDSC